MDAAQMVKKKALNFPFCAYFISIRELPICAEGRELGDEYMYFHGFYADAQALAQ
jgi:hypothetical protein